MSPSVVAVRNTAVEEEAEEVEGGQGEEGGEEDFWIFTSTLCLQRLEIMHIFHTDTKKKKKI